MDDVTGGAFSSSTSTPLISEGSHRMRLNTDSKIDPTSVTNRKQLVWLITVGTVRTIHDAIDSPNENNQGCSSGLGAYMSLEALSRGDIVISTSRSLPPPSTFLHPLTDTSAIPSLLTLIEAGADVRQLDTTSSFPKLVEFAQQVIEKYGRLDVLVNNTGYPAVGSLEELGYRSISLTMTLKLVSSQEIELY